MLLSREYYKALIKEWNENNEHSAQQLISIVKPIIKRFSKIQFESCNFTATPFILYSHENIAQDIAEKLLLRQKSSKFDSPNHMFSELRDMVFSVINDYVRKMTTRKRDITTRLLANYNVKKIKILTSQQNASDDYAILPTALNRLSAREKLPYYAFYLKYFVCADINEISNYLKISSTKVRRLIPFAETATSVEINKIKCAV